METTTEKQPYSLMIMKMLQVKIGDVVYIQLPLKEAIELGDELLRIIKNNMAYVYAEDSTVVDYSKA